MFLLRREGVRVASLLRNLSKAINKSNLIKMATNDVPEDVIPYQNEVKEKGDIVRGLKEAKADGDLIKHAVSELKQAKHALDEKLLELSRQKTGVIDQAKLADLLKQRFFYHQSFSIYGGASGLYDYGPSGAAMMDNILTLWNQFFVLNEKMLPVRTACLTPETVLKTSGHVDKFADHIVKDLVNGDCFRADHLIKDHLEKLLGDAKTSEEIKHEVRKLLPKVDGFNVHDMKEVMKRFNMKSPGTNYDLADPQEFNLMFATSFGPIGQGRVYLRPETAQGIFVNFKSLLDIKRGKLPFAAAQIGLAFRNEIAPRNGLLRVREFLMAEIEHFCDPRDKSHKKFKTIENIEMTFYSACDQMDGKLAKKLTIGEAVKSGLVNNETLGYYLARVFLFLTKIGVSKDRLRFRQHMSNEMAHYAADCWDAECETSYGWIECVGNADRSCYDLSQHSKVSKVKLVAERKLPVPVKRAFAELELKKDLIGKKFRGECKAIVSEFENFGDEQILAIEKHFMENEIYILETEGKAYEIEKNMINVKRTERTCHTEEFTPSVIEPSFGIGRIMHVIFEHTFQIREDDAKRTYLSLPALIAPCKVVILPLSGNAEFEPFVEQMTDLLTEGNISNEVDESAVSIGRRYARNDQTGVPFGITVDFDTVKNTPHTVTLRERDSMEQIRAEITEIPKLVRDLCGGSLTWEEVKTKYPVFIGQEDNQ